MPTQRFSQFIRDHYEIHEWRHATAILERDFPEQWIDVSETLEKFRLLKSSIIKPGGRKSGVAQAFDDELNSRGWVEKKFSTAVEVDGKRLESPTHAVDCYKDRIALEIEWNNKDPFYDRDLNNFRLLFELRVISVGIIITRCDTLQAIFDRLGRGTSFGQSTTHMSKLLPRLEGGGGGCPVLVFGIKDTLYVED
ncbi:BglII/BstYI family type II restriction endonuclease [Prosthecobacter dejongeii]|uniref:Restriction endonuclease BglII n=1 Tax=Prosthecobacter dejongeii TaxID=48465 RepID=A0A7W7YQP8_9BACT|nr:BglII/BstYI family type II restriction endonuclease [Prosthecobacter dejongeii]MBB5040613.1 hypothetical protein [Prosthecobacter dejongeii]